MTFFEHDKTLQDSEQKKICLALVEGVRHLIGKDMEALCRLSHSSRPSKQYLNIRHAKWHSYHVWMRTELHSLNHDKAHSS